MKSLSTKLAENGVVWVGGISLFLCLRGEKALFLVRSEKKVCTGEKIIAPPPTYHLVRPLPLGWPQVCGRLIPLAPGL